MVSAYLGVMVWSAYPSDEGTSRSAYAASPNAAPERDVAVPPWLPSTALAPSALSAAIPDTRGTPSVRVAEPAPERETTPCPEAMVHIGRYCIDRYEAHLVVVDAEGGETLHP